MGLVEGSGDYGGKGDAGSEGAEACSAKGGRKQFGGSEVDWRSGR